MKSVHFRNQVMGEMLMIISIIHLILANGNNQQVENNCKFETYCRMDKISQVVTCAHKIKVKMNCIPPIPENATTVIIKNGNFIHIDKSTFKTLRNSSVDTFKMMRCGIKFIDKFAFQGLKIKDLTFSNNMWQHFGPEQIAASLPSLNGSGIVNITLDDLGWTSLPRNMFEGLSETNITRISLKRNRIMYIDGSIFKNLKSLRELNLDWNPIADNNNSYDGLSAITKLTMTGTWFFFFPNFCDKNNQSYLPNLEVLNFDYSKINSLHKQIICLDNLKSLNLSGLSLRLLYDNTFSRLPSLTELYMRQMGSQFNKIRKYAFNSSSLTKLSFSAFGDFVFTNDRVDTFQPKYLFNNTRSLTHLDLSYTRFTLFDQYWRQIFEPLKNLKILMLKSVSMMYLPVNISGIFDNLLELHIRSNKISSWKNSEPFDNFPSLEVLNLDWNRISVINQSSFPIAWIKGRGTLKALNLMGNPFSCTCDLTWLREWMETFQAINLTSNTSSWQCDKTHIKVLDYHPNETLECLIEYIIPALTGLFICLVTAFICYIFRFRIKLAIYSCRSRRRDYRNIIEKECLFDCFVAYSYGDLPWVQDHLMPKLETEHNRRLCIRDRDFQLGTVFPNHIIENIEASKTVLLVLSEHFAKDVWCNFQLAVSNHLNIAEGQPLIIPVMLENISFQYINEPIYKIINASDFYVWSRDEAAETLFWSSLLQHIPDGTEYDIFLNNSIQTYDTFCHTRRDSNQTEC